MFAFTTNINVKISYQYVASFIGSIMIVVCGMLYGWTTPSLPQLLDPKSKIQITSSDGSWIAVMPAIGQPLGNILAANLANRIGRKKSILLASPVYLIAWFLIAFASNKYFYYASRILCGLADGIAFLVLPMYLGEIAAPKIRGMLCSCISAALVLGFLLIAIIGSTFSIEEAALIAAILPVIHIVLFAFMPESPYYLLMKDQQEEAVHNLIKLRGYEDVKDEISHLSETIKEDNSNNGKFLDLFTVQSNRKALGVALIMRTLQQFGGQMAITFYATIIFNEAGTNLSGPSCTSIYFGVQLFSTIISAVLSDKIGRKPLLAISGIGSSLALVIQGGYFYVKDNNSFELDAFRWTPLAALLIYDVAFSLGMATIPTLMLGELFTSSIKAAALCLADMSFGLVVLLATKFFQIMTDNFGMFLPFFVFSGFCGFTAIYAFVWFPETKGKSLEEIQEDFKVNN